LGSHGHRRVPIGSTVAGCRRPKIGFSASVLGKTSEFFTTLLLTPFRFLASLCFC
jgi:hypothetical protein